MSSLIFKKIILYVKFKKLKPRAFFNGYRVVFTNVKTEEAYSGWWEVLLSDEVITDRRKYLTGILLRHLSEEQMLKEAELEILNITEDEVLVKTKTYPSVIRALKIVKDEAGNKIVYYNTTKLGYIEDDKEEIIH
ncbi:MAG: hypothetical protein QW228_03325 [Candidatus Aenigmatarchaeota archaeon]